MVLGTAPARQRDRGAAVLAGRESSVWGASPSTYTLKTSL